MSGFFEGLKELEYLYQYDQSKLLHVDMNGNIKDKEPAKAEAEVKVSKIKQPAPQKSHQQIEIVESTYKTFELRRPEHSIISKESPLFHNLQIGYKTDETCFSLKSILYQYRCPLKLKNLNKARCVQYKSPRGSEVYVALFNGDDLLAIASNTGELRTIRYGKYKTDDTYIRGFLWALSGKDYSAEKIRGYFGVDVLLIPKYKPVEHPVVSIADLTKMLNKDGNLRYRIINNNLGEYVIRDVFMIGSEIQDVFKTYSLRELVFVLIKCGQITENQVLSLKNRRV